MSQRKGGPGRNDEWETPPDLFAALHVEFHFTLDAAATLTNSKVARLCDDGLVTSWENEMVWCNPPYSNVTPWIEKAHDSQTHGGTAVMLLTVTPETQAWKANILGVAAEVRFLARRVRFHMNGVPAKASHTLPSAVVVFRQHFGGTRYFSWDWKEA
jgi:site-specific DNA-methyltransferase (adenine-specific)